MSRILLLLIFLLWMTGTAESTPRPPGPVWTGVAIFIGGYALVVLGLGLWSRLLSRRVAAPNFGRGLRRFNRMMVAARLFVPAWFAVGVFALGWGWIVEQQLRLAALGPIRLPSMLLGTLPAVLAWMGLWWSQYPAERALREQHIWTQLEEGTPLHAPPGFREYFLANLRLQILFTLVPVLLIVGVRDVVAATIFQRHVQRAAVPAMVNGTGAGAMARGGERPGEIRRGDGGDDLAEFLTFLSASGLVFLFAPEILRRVLKTSPLPDGPLRCRLENLCRRAGMRHRDILVWHTHFNMGNAAVMGVVPWMRYVMLSDLLLERLDAEQIEAVFAHEVGHVVHRHMLWFAIFFLILVLGSIGPFALMNDWLVHVGLSDQVLKPLGAAAGVTGVWVIFGFLSRRFERQADVYAARVIESNQQQLQQQPATVAAAVADADAHRPDSFVGRYGATLFTSALHRVAVINNIPVSPRTPRDGGLLQRMGYLVGSFVDLAHDWLHGSIPSRMSYLHGLSTDPARTNHFDRVMIRLYCALLFFLFASAAWTWMALAQSRCAVRKRHFCSSKPT